MIELVATTPPTGDAILLADVKKHLRVDISDDDALIAALTAAAAQHVGGVIAWRTLQETTWRATFDTWDGADVWLPMPPVQSVTAVAIVDESVVPPVVVTVSAANTVLDAELGRLHFV